MAAGLQDRHPALRHIVRRRRRRVRSRLVGTDRIRRRRSIFADLLDTSAPALLLVSGGTTGLPKLIARTHDDYVYNAGGHAPANAR